VSSLAAEADVRLLNAANVCKLPPDCRPTAGKSPPAAMADQQKHALIPRPTAYQPTPAGQ